MNRTLLAALVLILLFPAIGRSQQQDALTTVQGQVNNVLKMLRSPALKGEKGEKEKRAQIASEAEKLFDYMELSKRTLGLEWNRFSLDQRKDFVNLYKALLQGTYVDRITQ
jgi:phospholipid transport system substrate-binding protein